MATTLAHRGPDGDGAAIAGHAALGCRRLAIIDVAGGVQPLRNETGDVIAVCNGEIYNSAPLRSALEARGHRFRTRSDAEVLPHLYEEHGLDFVDFVDGMFGLALWDARRGRLVLARDRLGEKPLYYAAAPDGFFFASEPKALLASGAVSNAPDWDALAVYLRTGFVPAPASAFHDIVKLPPGGRLVLEGEGLAVDRYWEVAPLLAAPPLALDLEAAAEALRAHLARAVRAALVSDVPLGLFLSGGLDSTAIAALARPAVDGELATFALGFDVAGFDEREHAALAARALRTRHRTLTITPELFLEGLRYLIRRFLEAAETPAAARHRAWTGCVGAELLASIAAPDGPLAVPPEPDTPVARSEVDALLALDLTGYLADDLLPKLDRATMAASLEGRAPYLDHHLVEFACRLPVELKLRGLSSKRVLKRAVADLVPGPIRRRVKRGLTVPLAAWLAGPLLPFVRATLARLDAQVIRPEAVRALLDEHVERRRDNRRELWALIVLELWREGAGVA